MKIFIRSAGNISPQRTLEPELFFQSRNMPLAGMLTAIEPDYDQYINSKMIRRMSRIVKMGVSAALQCLKNAGVEMPGAIITATGYGCLEDSALFLQRMIEFDEKLLSPTAFIQSTHNTVGAQIALLLNCHQYNNTIVHRAFSFENALIESALLLEEGFGPLLLGAIDENTRERQAILSRFGLYRQTKSMKPKEFDQRTGNIAGEGAAFFLLDKEPGTNPMAVLKDVKTLQSPAPPEEVINIIGAFLQENSLSMEDIGLVLTAQTGNGRMDESEHFLLTTVLSGIPHIPFKYLCGDYPTATGFALWLAAWILKEQRSPFWMQEVKFPIRNILIHNHTENNQHSVFIIGSC